MIDIFSNPDLSFQEAAFSDGLLHWHRKDVANPWLVDGIPVNSRWWYWDFGRREGVYMNAVRKAALTESDRVNAETLGKLDAAAAQRGAGWFRSRAAGGAA